jgi:hypothetical protein
MMIDGSPGRHDCRQTGILVDPFTSFREAIGTTNILVRPYQNSKMQEWFMQRVLQKRIMQFIVYFSGIRSDLFVFRQMKFLIKFLDYVGV